MLFYKSSSLELLLKSLFVFYIVIILILGVLLLSNIGYSIWLKSSIFLLVLVVMVLPAVYIYKKVICTLDRALLHLDAVRTENYNTISKSAFKTGRVAEFHRQLKSLSSNLAENKLFYGQQAFLIYQLIDQLNTPILVFNQKERLSYANDAFRLLYDEDWRMFRYATTKALGLEKINQCWRLKKNSNDWHISQSVFIDNGETYQLLVFTNIELEITESQLNAWQKIVRVIGHEINNSLTPVSSLAESLMESTTIEQDRHALALISDRCMHLQAFINKFSSVTKPLKLDCQQINVVTLLDKLEELFPSQYFTADLRIDFIWADRTFLEQVLINLVKNSVEAGAKSIYFEAKNKNDKAILMLVDDGEAVASSDNLFVPLFTTKPTGSGLGLSFCRKVIIRHGGSIVLQKNHTRGMSAIISMPYHLDKLKLQSPTS